MKIFTHLIIYLAILGWCSCTDFRNENENSNSELLSKDTTGSKSEKPYQEEVSLDFFKKKYNKGIDFYAVGNEPFWSLNMDFEKGFQFSTPEMEYSFPPVEPDLAQDAPIKRYRIKTESIEILIKLRKEKCTDTMSGQEFSHTVLISFKGGDDTSFTDFAGCGRYVPNLSLHDIWGLVEYGGQEVPNLKMPKGAIMELNPINESMMYSDNCNSFAGTFYTQGEMIHFGNLAGTLKACPDMNINEDIGAGLNMENYQYERKGSQLVFYNNSGEVYKWKKID